MSCHLLTCPSYFIPGDCRLLWHFLWQRLRHQGKQQWQQPGHLTETQLCSHFRVFLLPKASASNRRTSFPTADISIYPAEAAVWNSRSLALRAAPTRLLIALPPHTSHFKCVLCSRKFLNFVNGTQDYLSHIKLQHSFNDCKIHVTERPPSKKIPEIEDR